MVDSNLVNLKNRYQDEADQKAWYSNRWKTFFNFASIEEVQPWKVVAFIYDKKSGTNLAQKHFHLQRVAKLLASVEDSRSKEISHTKIDLVNWNRKAIQAMIEVARKFNEQKSIQRGEKALELINILFPEYLLEE